MKKLLFILFFPITVPAYLLYKFFAWFFSEGLPDTVSFFRRRILPWFKSYAAYKSDELKEITESEAAEEEKTESEMTADVATEEETSVDEPTEIGGASKETLEYIQHMLINQNKKTTVDLPNPVKGPSPNRNNAAKEAAPASKEKSIIISRTVFDDPESFISEITVSESGSGITVTGHLPPYTPEEYRKIRHYETQNQIKRLKKNQKLDSFDACYDSATIYEFWGARYRLLAIDCFCNCLLYDKPTPNFPLIELRIGDLYKKGRDFPNAIHMYKKTIELNPESVFGYIGIAQCLLKQNQIDKAIAFLEEVKQTDYYLHPAPYTYFDNSVDDMLKDYLAKKERGYVFKPRKQTFDYIYPHTVPLDEICEEYLRNWE